MKFKVVVFVGVVVVVMVIGIQVNDLNKIDFVLSYQKYSFWYI